MFPSEENLSEIKKICYPSSELARFCELNALLGFYCARKDTDRIKILSELVFENQIFCGAGNRDPKRNWTGQLLAVLYWKLDHAIDAMGAMQQNGGMGTKFDHDYDRVAGQEIERTVRDIAMALTGKRIKFVETVQLVPKE